MRSACNMNRMCRERKSALVLVKHVLQGSKGSTMGTRGLFVGNWTKDPRGNRFNLYLSGQSLGETTAQNITSQK